MQHCDHLSHEELMDNKVIDAILAEEGEIVTGLGGQGLVDEALWTKPCKWTKPEFKECIFDNLLS